MAAIAALVDSSPDALNTLNELAAALGNDPNFATTMTNALAGKQPKDATLTALAELATSADKLPYFTGADRAALTALTSVGRAILGKTSTQGVLDYLHLEETVKQAAGAMQKSANGGDIQNVAAFRNALQLGTAALASMGVGKNQVLSASDFSFFAGGNGYLYIPCLATTDNPVKIMLQWGTIRTRGGENNIYNLPYAFPTAGLWAMGCRAANGYSQSMNVSIENRSQIRIQNWAPAGAVEDCCFFAVGYL
ncbi:gp53-like domain-containing protein [Escherichia coli]|uniref:gp53-like domain-containing protein n=1 Tax=Escherichia coli TaxID=562 RepID=UPI003D8027A1